MLINLDNANNYSLLEPTLQKYTDAVFIFVGANTSYIKAVSSATELLKQNRAKKIVFICFLSQFFADKNTKNLIKIKKFVTLSCKKQYNTYFVRIGDILEDPNNIVNKKIEQITVYKKTTFTKQNSKFYFISISDFKLGIELMLNTPTQCGIYNFSLNLISENKILTTLEQFFKFKKQIVNSDEKYIKYPKISFKSSEKIKFKPQNTLKTFIKSNKSTIKEDYKPKSNFFKFNLKWALTPFLILITWGVFFVFDFAFDNFYLYQNIKVNDINKVLYYSNKLRNKNLPTEYGANYTHIYNTVFYFASAVDIYNKNNKLPSKETIESINESIGKAVSFGSQVNKQLLITNKEKEFYSNYKPLIEELGKNTNYEGIIQLLNQINRGLKVVVLIQNSNELRPSGGFVGSYALLETKDFKLTQIKFDDIYNIDGTLEKNTKNLVKMPEEYKEFIKTDYFFARDLNLLLNINERNISYIKYFEEALNTNIDGIIYINTYTIKRLLKIVGPIYLSSYNETVNEENVDTLAQTYSEKNYYKGSSQKQNFLSVLGGRVIEKLKNDTNNQLLNNSNFANVLLSLNNKEIELYFKNTELNSLLQNTGFLQDTKIKENEELLYILESNLGENKVNKLVEKNVNYNIKYDVRRGTKITEIEITLQNKSTDYNFPYGDYKGLLHIYTPTNLLITESAFLDKEKEVDISNKRSITTMENNLVVNLPFLVKPGEENTIKLSFEEQVNNYDKQKHTLKVIKQPGSKNYNLTVNLEIPDITNFNKGLIISKDTYINLH